MGESNKAPHRGAAAALDVGVLMLDNRLPRPVGDVGNARTFEYPVAYGVIPEADSRRVIEQQADGLADSVRDVADDLVQLGSRSLTTCCGFLAIFQPELTKAAPVPVATSSLLQIPLVLEVLAPEENVAVLTVNASTLTREYFSSVGVTDEHLDRVTVVGLEDTEHFYQMIIGAIDDLDVARARAEVVAAAVAARRDEPRIGAYVFECTNLPPYADAVRQETGLPVWDATSMINWLQAGVAGDRPW